MSERQWFTKKPCEHCPFRQTVRPFLHPERGEELAYLTKNPYAEFPCHKTTVEDEDDSGEMVWGAKSLVCAGFLSMQIEHAGINCPEGFEPSQDVYSDPNEMADTYALEWEKSHA